MSINFDTDPLVPRIVDGYLRATGTSLGADNGIGIAACFAILEDNSIKHGPLEVLVTRDRGDGHVRRDGPGAGHSEGELHDQCGLRGGERDLHRLRPAASPSR